MNLQISDTDRAMLGHARRAALVTGLGLAASAANAAEPVYTSITSAADWTSVAAGVITIFAALALVLVALKGGRKLLSAIGR